jgi:hypothetical protein
MLIDEGGFSSHDECFCDQDVERDLPGLVILCPHLTPQGLYPPGSDLPGESFPDSADLAISLGMSMNTVAQESGILAFGVPNFFSTRTHEVVLVPTFVIPPRNGSTTSAGTSRSPNSFTGAATILRIRQNEKSCLLEIDDTEIRRSKSGGFDYWTDRPASYLPPRSSNMAPRFSVFP